LVDQNGQLTVSAKELRSGAHAQVTVQPAHGLTNAEVEQLVNDSIENAREDFAARRFIELKNKAEADLRHTEKALAQAGNRLSASERTAIDGADGALRSAIAGSDLGTLQKAIDAFAAATNPLATSLMNEVVKQSLAGTSEAALKGEPS
ncbi:MAG TPA: Hsp70 family protein, partial [Urbifossiella sp.]|nr:Hsp70 family protein [Urbifossiella sp.]